LGSPANFAQEDERNVVPAHDSGLEFSPNLFEDQEIEDEELTKAVFEIAEDHNWFISSSSSSSSSETETASLTRKEKNRLSAKASRDKKKYLIQTFTKKVECLENEKKALLTFLSRLPRSTWTWDLDLQLQEPAPADPNEEFFNALDEILSFPDFEETFAC
jgi:hypothetical protein